MNVLAELQPIFRDIFDDETLIVTNETSSENIEDWDSLAHIRLIAAIEKHFGIKFSLVEIMDLENTGDMANLISAKLDQKN